MPWSKGELNEQQFGGVPGQRVTTRATTRQVEEKLPIKAKSQLVTKLGKDKTVEAIEIQAVAEQNKTKQDFENEIGRFIQQSRSDHGHRAHVHRGH